MHRLRTHIRVRGISIVLFLSLLASLPVLAKDLTYYVERDARLKLQTSDVFGPNAPQPIEVVQQASHGRVVIVDGATILYLTDPGFEGYDQFTLTAGTGNTIIEQKIHVAVGAAFVSQADVVYERLAELLFALAVVAIFLEIALSTLFRNRLFFKADTLPGIKTIVSFLVAALVVWTFNFDIFREVMAAIKDGEPGNRFVSGLITALLLAGGSSTVFFLYTKLGIRNPFNQQGLSGTGTLKVSVVRGSIPATEKIALKLDDGTLLGVIQPNQSEFGGDKGYQVKVGVYVLKAIADDAKNQQQAVSKTVVVEPTKLSQVDFTFA